MKTILIVDDERDVLLVLDKRLTNEGYSVFSSDNSNDAMMLARSKHPDLIILDIVMPDTDGSALAEKLGDDPRTKDIPIIFLTSLLSRQEEERMRQVNAGHPIFAKPYDSQKLLAEIERLCNEPVH